MLCLSRRQQHLSDVSVLGFGQNMVERRVPLFLMTKLGQPDATAIFVNDYLAEALAQQDADLFVDTMARMIRTLSAATSAESDSR